jgi:hypothetical protein
MDLAVQSMGMQAGGSNQKQRLLFMGLKRYSESYERGQHTVEHD